MNRKQYILETLERQHITEISAMDGIHLGLDVAGMIPGIGAVADLTNAGLYAAKGQKGMAALSLAAAIPGAGLAAGATKIAKGVSKLGKTAAASKTAAKVGSAASKTAAKVGSTASRAATKVGVKTAKAAKTGVAAATGAKIAAGMARGGTKAKIAAGLAGAKIASKMPTTFFRVAKSGRAGKAALAAAVATKVGTKGAMVGAKAAAKGAKVAGKVGAKAGKAAVVAGKVAAKPTAKAAIQVGSRTIPRAAVLARGDVADTMGFDKGGKAAKDVQVGIPMGIAKGEGQAAIDKTVGGIKDALSKVPGAARNVMAKLDDYKLGSFQG